VSGRVVREITQDELGLLRIGNNATDYAWDGKDEFGDQLANGVYLYKVIIRKNGDQVELRESGGDRGFKNGYGKLYLLR
jgi:flagellar hook assembly protein FlgD